MSLLDKASLIVTPNAYKESKLYSVVPSDGSGDMTVVRATTATRVNSAGLIEVVPRNLLEYSEQFNNAYWVKQDITVTANATTAPNGTMTADSVVPTAVTTTHQISKSAVTSAQHTMSVYAKANGYDTIEILDFTNGVNGAIFNLTNGTLTNRGSGVGTITNVGNGWYRCTATAITTGIRFYIPNSLPNFTGNGTSGLFIWGAQLDLGATATEYFPTTTRLNIPRIDYTNGSCPSLLVEPQRTNLLTYSNDYSNVSWGKVGVTATLGTQVNPEGIASTYSISNTTLGDSYLQKQGLSTTAGNYTMSVFVKNVDNVVSSQLMAVHLTQGSVTSQFTYTWATNTFTLAGTNAISGSSVLLSNGWVRLTFTYSIGAGVVNHWARLYANNNLTITKSVLVYGFQTEAGSYPTSYIPTVASSVTRNADLISKTGISSLIGTTYTVYGEIINEGIHNARHLALKLPTGGNYDDVVFIVQYFNGLQATANNSSSTAQFTINSGSYSIGQTLKYALRCEQNNVAFYINGVQIGVDTLCTIPAVSTLYIGNYVDLQLGSKIKSTIIFPSALTNTELAQLTTL